MLGSNLCFSLAMRIKNSTVQDINCQAQFSQEMGHHNCHLKFLKSGNQLVLTLDLILFVCEQTWIL